MDENLSEEGLVPGKVAVSKRKNMMTNIKSRLNSNAYNIARNYMRNEKDVLAKVKFFEKKEAMGQLKGYMVPRLEGARALLERLRAKKNENAPALNQPIRNLGATLPANLPANLPAQKAKTRRKFKLAVPAASPSILAGASPVVSNRPFLPVPNIAEATPIPAAIAKTRRKFKLAVPESLPSILEEDSPNNRAFQPNASSVVPFANAISNAAVNRPNTISNTVSESGNNTPFVAANTLSTPGNVTAAKTRRRYNNAPQNEYLLEASQVGVPELYDPFTGRKFEPQEDPMPAVETAYKMLTKLHRNVYRKAATLRRKAKKNR